MADRKCYATHDRSAHARSHIEFSNTFFQNSLRANVLAAVTCVCARDIILIRARLTFIVKYVGRSVDDAVAKRFAWKKSLRFIIPCCVYSGSPTHIYLSKWKTRKSNGTFYFSLQLASRWLCKWIRGAIERPLRIAHTIDATALWIAHPEQEVHDVDVRRLFQLHSKQVTLKPSHSVNDGTVILLRGLEKMERRRWLTQYTPFNHQCQQQSTHFSNLKLEISKRRWMQRRIEHLPRLVCASSNLFVSPPLCLTRILSDSLSLPESLCYLFFRQCVSPPKS